MRNRATVSTIISGAILCSGSVSYCFAANANGPIGNVLQERKPTLDSAFAPKMLPKPQARLFQIHAGVTQEYILGPGDVLSVTDISEDKPATSIAPILPDGTCVISFTGVVQAAGLSLRQINALVNDNARKWYVNPQIMVNLAKQRSTQVYLLGEVSHPGLYSTGADSGIMPESGGGSGSDSGSESGSGGGGMGAAGAGAGSNMTLTAALQLAGGLKETADVRHIRITRLAPKQTFPIDLWKLMIDGDISEDIVLQPGDVIYVPKGGVDFDAAEFGRIVNNSPKVRVFGSVKSPGLLSMSPDDDVLSVIAKSGGFESTASSKYVYLARTRRDGTVTSEKINFKKGVKDGRAPARAKLHPGDVIIVKRSPSKTVAVTVGRTLPMLVFSAMNSMLLSRLYQPNSTAVGSSTSSSK